MSDDERVGREFGHYRIERVLGRGGFGTVYLAEDLNPHLRRRVALKVLNRELAADQAFRERFLRESLMAIELDHHPSIVPVYDAGEQEDTLYIAMRYIEGPDLLTAIAQRGPLQPEEALTIVSQVASALDAAHGAGLVHRDVKPGNVLLSPDMKRAYLADFGLTKRVSAESGITRVGQFLGTFYYAAPEQIEGRAVDGRTDLYALGCVLYEALTGGPPFSGDMSAIIAAHLTQPPPSATAARAGLPPAVDAVIVRAMAKLPDQRYQTGAEFAEAATRALSRAGETVHGRTPPPPPPSVAGPVTPP
ncbi:MAG: serine/threonine-protein kinase, partial [Acidimicrobiia bacterium]